MDASTALEQFKTDLRAQLLDPDGEQTDEQTLRSVKYLEARLRAVWLEIEKQGTPSDRSAALHNLARYAGWLLLMFEQGLGNPIEFYGWISRSLFELYALTRFVLTSEENLRLFLDATATDEIMMLDGILKLPGGSPGASAKLQATLDRLKTIRGTADVRLPDYATIAARAGVKDEYDSFWKLYSKYVHPSSWVVNGAVQHVRNLAYQKIFQMQAQFNAHRLLVLVETNRT